MFETDIDKLDTIKKKRSAAQYDINILQRLLRKAKKLGRLYEIDRIIVELIKRNVIKIDSLPPQN
jgi:hypothetical protein